MKKMNKKVGQNAQNDNEEPAVVDGDAAVDAIIGPYQIEPPPRARERGEQQNYGDARLVDPARLLNRDWYVKGTSHDSIFQFSLFSTLADIFAV